MANELPAEDGLLEGCVIAIEHGHLCVRNKTGWLLSARSLKDRVQEWPFDGVIAEATKNQRAWLEGKDG